MKDLTQAVFDLPDCPVWSKSAAVDSSGWVWFFDCLKKYLKTDNRQWLQMTQVKNCNYPKLGVVGYNTTNWQNSAINREVKAPNQPTATN